MDYHPSEKDLTDFMNFCKQNENYYENIKREKDMKYILNEIQRLQVNADQKYDELLEYEIIHHEMIENLKKEIKRLELKVLKSKQKNRLQKYEIFLSLRKNSLIHHEYMMKSLFNKYLEYKNQIHKLKDDNNII